VLRDLLGLDPFPGGNGVSIWLALEQTLGTLGACAIGGATLDEIGLIAGPPGATVGIVLGCLLSAGSYGTSIINNEPIDPGALSG
jgi:hypothetical protein